MPILRRSLKLRAAAGSMHQFMGVVRGIYPDVVEDPACERVTAFLYESVTRSVFGDSFAVSLRAALRPTFRFNPVYDVETALGRIDAQVQALLEVPDADVQSDRLHGEFTHHVRCVIRAILLEVDPSWDDPQIVRLVFPRFEAAARRIHRHLAGLRKQSDFMMR